MPTTPAVLSPRQGPILRGHVEGEALANGAVPQPCWRKRRRRPYYLVHLDFAKNSAVERRFLDASATSEFSHALGICAEPYSICEIEIQETRYAQEISKRRATALRTACPTSPYHARVTGAVWPVWPVWPGCLAAWLPGCLTACR